MLLENKQKVPLIFTANDAVAMMNSHRAESFRNLADHLERHEYDKEDVLRLINELADDAEAQALVVNLRDYL